MQHALDRRRVSLIGWLALLAAAAIAWVLTAQYAMGMPPAPGTMGLGFFGFLLLWTLMMAAMMLPSVAPVVSLYQRSVRAQASGWTLVLRSVGLVVGYLVAWALFGVVAYFVALWGSWLATRPGLVDGAKRRHGCPSRCGSSSSTRSTWQAIPGVTP